MRAEYVNVLSGSLVNFHGTHGLDKEGASQNASRFYQQGSDIRFVTDGPQEGRLEVTNHEKARFTLDRVEEPWAQLMGVDWSAA